MGNDKNSLFIKTALEKGYSQDQISKFLSGVNPQVEIANPKVIGNEDNNVLKGQSAVMDFFGSGLNAAVDMVKSIPMISKSVNDLTVQSDGFSDLMKSATSAIDKNFKYTISPDYNKGIIELNEDGSMSLTNLRSLSNGLGNGLGQVGLAMAIGGGSPWRRLAVNTLMNFPSVYESAEKAGLNKKDAARFSLLLAPILGATEEIGGVQPYLVKNLFGKLAAVETKQVISKLRNETIIETLQKAAKGELGELSEQEFGKLAKETSVGYLRKLKELAPEAVKGALPEMSQEMFQDALQQGAEQIYDKLYAGNSNVGEGKFGTEFITDDPNKQFGGISIGGYGITKKAVVSQVNNGVLGGILGAGSHIAIHQNPEALQQTLFGFIDDNVRNDKGESAINRINKLVKLNVASGKMDEATGNVMLQKAQQIYDVADRWKTIDDNKLDAKTRYEAYDLTANVLPLYDNAINNFEQKFKAKDLETALSNIDNDENIDDFQKGALKSEASGLYGEYWKATRKRDVIKSYLQEIGAKGSGTNIKQAFKSIDENTPVGFIVNTAKESIAPGSTKETNQVQQSASIKSDFVPKYDANESEGQALSRITEGISNMPAAEQDAEIQKRAKDHAIEYNKYLESNPISEETKAIPRVAKFGEQTAKAMKDIIENPKKWESKMPSGFANGSRIDENGAKMPEQTYIDLKEHVKKLRAKGNLAEIDKVNAAPTKYHAENFKNNIFLTNKNQNNGQDNQKETLRNEQIGQEKRQEVQRGQQDGPESGQKSNQENALDLPKVEGKISANKNQLKNESESVNGGITESPEGAEEAAILHSLGLSLEGKQGTREGQDASSNKTDSATSKRQGNEQNNGPSNEIKPATDAISNLAESKKLLQQNTEQLVAGLSLEDAKAFIKAHAIQSKNDGYAPRPDFGLSTEELQRGLTHIEKGKRDSKAAFNVLEKIAEWRKAGFVDIIALRGGASYRFSIPYELSLEENEFTEPQVEELIEMDKAIDDNSEMLDQLVEEKYTNKDGSLDKVRLLADIEDAMLDNYFGEFLSFSKEDLLNLQQRLIKDEESSTRTKNATNERESNDNATKEQEQESTVEKSKTEELDDEIAGLWEDLADAIGAIKKFDGKDGSNNAKAFEIGIKLVSAYTKKGIYTLAEISEDMLKKFGEAAKELLPFVKDAYNATRGRITDKELRKKFNTEDEVLDFELNTTNLDNNKNENNGTNDRTGVSEISSGTTERTDVGGGKLDPVSEGQQQDLFQGVDSNRETGGEGNRGTEQVSSKRGEIQDNGVSSERSGRSRKGVPIFIADETAKNFVIEDSKERETFNPKRKFSDNINALKTLSLILKEKRSATEEEQKILSKYVGWGGLKVVLNSENTKWTDADEQLRPQYIELKEIVSALEEQGIKNVMAGIKGSTQNAHFTPTPVIRSIYSAIESFGFDGGKILEPSAGIGNFFGAMPLELQSNSQLSSVELDPLTGNILRLLYPKSSTTISGLENADLPNNYYDLVISNVPFGTYGVFDKSFTSPILKSISSKIHNYFFAKSIQQAKDGGLIALVTSAGVLDSNSNVTIRQYINDNAEFIGAIRMPSSAFVDSANTQVVADIIFLRKTKNPVQRNSFINTESLKVKHKDSGAEKLININEYFIKNPSHAIGEFQAGGQFNENQMTLTAKKGVDIAEEISKIIRNDFPRNIYVKQQSHEKIKSDEPVISSKISTVNNGELFIDLDGKAYKKIGTEEKEELAKTHSIRKVNAFILLRDTLQIQYELESEGIASTLQIEENRRLLNKAYDGFKSKYGTLEKNSSLINKDVNGFNILSLENKDKETKAISKADIFRKRVIQGKKIITEAKNIEDAISISINESGYIHAERVASLLNTDVDSMVNDNYGIVFYDSDNKVVSREEYLSGNVKKKLAEAITLAETNPIYKKNIEELNKVLPEDVPAGKIDVNLGARWVSPKIYQQFTDELLNTKSNVIYTTTGDSYSVDGNITVEANSKYGTNRINAFNLIEKALQGQSPVIRDKVSVDPDKYVTNKIETEKAQVKQDEIIEAFKNWIWKDADRRAQLGAIYNAKFNTTVKRKYNGSNLTFDGLNNVSLRQHQLDADAMLIANMGGIIDHIVGAGKTYVMITTAIKMKQLGLVNKPTITGLKSTISHLEADARKAFPNAKILVPSETDFTAKKRKMFLSKIQNNDWDLIIMSHEQFGSIPQDSEMLIETLNSEIAVLDDEIYAMERESGQGASKRVLTGLEQRKKTLEAKLSELINIPKDEGILDFKKIGIDKLFVDESQMFKNLEYSTRINKVAGLGNAKGSKRAFNLLTAIRTLQKLHGGDKGVTFLSGTPISNSLVEMYLLFKYLRPGKMQELGYVSFDAWVKQFAEQSNSLEFSVTGSFKQNTRFRRFINVPELSMLYSEITDLRNDSNLVLPKPKIRAWVDENGVKQNSPQLVLSVQSPYQQEWTNRLIEFAQQEHKNRDGHLIGKGDLTDAQQTAAMLMVTNLSNKLSIDMRLIDKNAEDNPTGKLSELAKVVAKEYFDSSDIKGTQLIFCDTGTPKAGNTVEDLKGYMEDELNIPDDEIVAIFGEAEAKTKPLAEIREKLFTVLEYDSEIIDQLIKDAKESEGQFNVYDEVKKKLINKGIPAEQIVFIHSYKTKTQKKELFDSVNMGNIRVVIGSTQKLGTGVNAQAKIVAMHHIDAKWNPAAMEQRNGRGIRQGNENAEVAIYNYGTELTLDAYKYQLIATKQKFIDQVKSGALLEGERSIEEEDGEDMNATAMVARLSGNPLLIEQENVKSKAEKLKRQKRNFESDIYEAENKRDKISANIPNIKNELVKREADVKKIEKAGVTETGRPVVEAKINGAIPENTKNLGELIIAEKNKILLRPVGHSQLVGTVNGLELYGTVVKQEDTNLFKNTFEVELRLKGELGYSVTSSVDPTSQGVAIANSLAKLSNQLEERKKDLERSEVNLKKYAELANETWNKGEELDALIKRQAEIGLILNPPAVEENANPGDGSTGTEVDGELSYPMHDTSKEISLVEGENTRTKEPIYLVKINKQLDRKIYTDIVQPMIDNYEGNWNRKTGSILFTSKQDAEDFKNSIQDELDLSDESTRFAVGEQTTNETKNVRAIIDFFDKTLGTKLFAKGNEFASKLKEQGVELLSSPSGKVLGLVSDGKIYLNPEALSANAAFHELTHIQQAVIKIAAKNGDSKAKSILRRFDVLFSDVISQIKKGNRVVMLDGVKVDLSSDVYKKRANESEEAYTERLKDELWAYIQAPVNLAKWDKATTGIVSRFIERVKEWFKDKLGIKDADNIQSMTLAELINASSNSLMKGEYFENLDKASGEKGQPLFAIVQTTKPLIDNIATTPELQGIKKDAITTLSFPLELVKLKNRIKGRIGALTGRVNNSVAVADYLAEYMNNILQYKAMNADGTEKRFAFVEELERMRNELGSASMQPVLDDIYEHLKNGTTLAPLSSSLLNRLTEYHIQYEHLKNIEDALVVDENTMYSKAEFKAESQNELIKARNAIMSVLPKNKYGEWISNVLQKYALAVSSLPTWAKLLGGGENSILYKLSKALDVAQDKQFVMGETAKHFIDELSHSLSTKSNFITKDIAKSATEDIGDHFENYKGNKTKISEGELLHIYLTLRNAIVRARFFKEGNGIFELKEYRDKSNKQIRPDFKIEVTENDYQDLETKFSTPEYSTDIDGWIKANEFLFEYVNETHKQDTGVELRKADGFYYPLIHGKGIKSYADYLKANKFVDDLRSAKYRNPQQNANYLVVDALQVMNNYIDANTRYASFSTPLRNLDVYVAQNDNFFRANDMHKYVEWYNKFKKEFEDPSEDKLGEVGKRLLGGFVISRLGLNPFVTLKQYSSIFVSNTVIPAKYLYSSIDVLAKNSKGVIQSFNPYKELKNDAVMDEMMEHSATARRRLQGSQHYFDSIIKSGLSDFETVVMGKNIKIPFSRFTQNIISADKAVSAMYWVAAKKQVEAEMPYTVGSNEYWDAVSDIYGRAVVESQSSMDDVNRAHITKDASVLVKGLTLFSGQSFSNFNSFMGNVIEQANNPSLENKVKVGKSVMNIFVMNALMVAAVDSLKYAQAGDDEDKLKKKAFKSLISNSYQNFPILAPILDEVWSKAENPRYAHDINYPVLQVINDGAGVIGQLSNEKYDKAVQEAIKFGAEGIGLPISPYEIGKNILKKK